MIVAVKALVFAALLGIFCYDLHWTRQNNAALHAFATRNSTALVPMACELRRGLEGTDYVVGSAKRRTDARYVEACWYPVDRLRQLFPQYAEEGDAAIRRERFRDMNLRPREFTSKGPALALIVTALIASLMTALFGLLAMFGSRRRPEPELDPEPVTKIDPVILAESLAALRKTLGTDHGAPKM